ncbi:MAG TPA: hypothetical protein VI584_06735 [Nitrospiria bacterium]|nr:hypothetical protein [Nitrospiria bacterium]
MKKLFQVLGLIFAGLILAGVIAFVVIALKGGALDKESKAYVDEVTPKILADLRKETLLTYSSDELKNAVKPEDMDKLFVWFNKLGQFKEYKGSKGQANISVTTQAGKVITGHYVAEAEFDTGPAQVQIMTVKKGEKWFIQMFRINSMALAGG